MSYMSYYVRIYFVYTSKEIEDNLKRQGNQYYHY